MTAETATRDELDHLGPEVERLLLASALLDPDRGRVVLAELEGDDFLGGVTGYLFGEFMRLAGAGHRVDPPLLAVRADPAKFPGKNPHLAITDIGNEVWTSANLEMYAAIVLQESLRRRALLALEEAKQEGATAHAEGLSAWLDSLPATFAGLVRARGQLQKSMNASDLLLDVFESADPDRKSNRIEMGYIDLDDGLGGGVSPGDVVVIGGRTSDGKTTLAVNIAANICFHGDRRALFCSREMSPTQISEAYLQCCAGASLSLRAARRVHDEGLVTAYKRTAAAIEAKGSFFITQAETPSQLRQVVEKHVGCYGVSAVFVDYLQMLRPDNRRSNRELEVGDLSRAMKSIATDCGVAMFVLSQLSRQTEARRERKPELADLRESGAIENDADVVLLLYWPHKVDPKADERLFKVYIAKNRLAGICRPVRLQFLRMQRRFLEWPESFSSGRKDLE